ncbi:MAG: glycosyltransferase family 4 protein [Ferruginibacter sp.]
MLENKKILLVVGSLNQGGAEFQLLSLARLLQSRGLNVEVFAITDYDYFKPYVKQHQLKYSCVENKGSDFYRVCKAASIIRSKKPDLVISYIKKVSQVAILARLYAAFSFKLITSERTSLIKPRHDLFYFNLSRLANIITVNSVSKLNYIRKRFPFLSKKAVFMPNIIDIEKYRSIVHVPAENNIRLSFVGRISPEKNLLNLVKAIGILKNKNYKIQLRLTGAANNKAYFAEINQLISDEGLGEEVIYSGPVTEVKEVYRNTDLLCLVSIFEGFSNVLSEAICSGVPVLASDIEENRFLVKENENGFLVQPGDPESMAAGIEKFLLLSPAGKAAIAANNKAKAQELFNEERIYQQYLDLFKQVGMYH